MRRSPLIPGLLLVLLASFSGIVEGESSGFIRVLAALVVSVSGLAAFFVFADDLIVKFARSQPGQNKGGIQHLRYSALAGRRGPVVAAIVYVGISCAVLLFMGLQLGMTSGWSTVILLVSLTCSTVANLGNLGNPGNRAPKE